MQHALLDIINSSDIIVLTFESFMSLIKKNKIMYEIAGALNFKFLYLFIFDT